MNTMLVVMIGGFSVAAAVALVRGLMAFFRDAEHIRLRKDPDAAAFGVQQNRMMSQRVMFQGIAILLIVLIGALTSHK